MKLRLFVLLAAFVDVWKFEKDEARHKKLSDVVTRAVKYIGRAQSSQGGWYRTSKVGVPSCNLRTSIIPVCGSRLERSSNPPRRDL